MTQYTPGPWVAKQIPGLGANTLIFSESPDGHPYNDWTYIAQDVSGHANARLITAAPELCEALKCLVERFEGCMSHYGSPELAAFRNAHAAISKTEVTS